MTIIEYTPHLYHATDRDSLDIEEHLPHSPFGISVTI